ncbi:metallopeptidase family protein [Litorihabitans aurantiacus]|uniref:Metallopeptidase family protein n=1 Tax=Litorihabitans aurantiacus TaxID=1930061 RepID=A0AA37UMD3_9MICO|nr:metallopeptidase family protein [Litorihabitans aurantiacus]GMA30634.1 hypothetical protein GCM10025875_06260 [Litorihabitans aurantiacus]
MPSPAARRPHEIGAGTGVDQVSIPSRRGARRRDRRGRGLRGPLLPPGMPASRSRAEKFDDAVLDLVEALEKRWQRELRGVEYAVEDVPPSDPSPWERGVPLGRYFAADPAAGLAHRVVLYRRALEERAEDDEQLRDLVREVLVEQVARLLGKRPDEVDPGYQAD